MGNFRHRFVKYKGCHVDCPACLDERIGKLEESIKVLEKIQANHYESSNAMIRTLIERDEEILKLKGNK